MHFQGAAVWKGSWYARRPCSPIVLHVLHVLLPSPSHVDLAYLGMLKTRLQGYEVSLHKLVSDLEAFSAKLTNLNPILPILLPRSNSSSWSLICNDKAQSTCKVSTMCILCGMMCDKRPKPCNMVFTKIHQETSADGKNQNRSFLAEQLWLLNVISSPLTSPLERWFAFATDGAIWVPHKPWIIFLIVLWTKLSSTQPIAAPYIGCPCAILGLQTLYATVSPLLSSLKRRTGLPHCHHILPWAPVAGQGARQVRSGAEPSRWLAIHQTGSSLLIAFGCIWLCAGLYLVHIWLRLMLSHFKCSEML